MYSELYMGRDSSLGVATRYGLDGPRIESGWGWDFPASVQTGSWAPPTGYRLFPGDKAARAWRWPPFPPSSAEVKERVELYLYSPFGPSWPLLGWPLPLHWAILLRDKQFELDDFVKPFKETDKLTVNSFHESCILIIGLLHIYIWTYMN